MVAAYLYLIKIRILTSLTYRFELIFAILKQIIFISLNLLLWKTLYSDKAAVSNVTYEQMLTFTILIAFLNNVYVHNSDCIIINSKQLSFQIKQPEYLIPAHI